LVRGAGTQLKQGKNIRRFAAVDEDLVETIVAISAREKCDHSKAQARMAARLRDVRLSLDLSNISATRLASRHQARRVGQLKTLPKRPVL